MGIQIKGRKFVYSYENIGNERAFIKKAML